MPSMLCTYERCGEMLRVPTGTAEGPLPPCPECGHVSYWPPTSPQNFVKRVEEWEDAAHAVRQRRREVERQQEEAAAQARIRELKEKIGLRLTPPLDAPYAIEECPECKRQLRLPFSRAGEMAHCPRHDYRAVFAWDPGQEIEGFEAWCSFYRGDDQRFSVTCHRPKGSQALFRLKIIEKGTGHMDRVAAGNNYDAISEHGDIRYNRTQRGLPYDAFDLAGFCCPWCQRRGISQCGHCKAISCDEEDFRKVTLRPCPSCNKRASAVRPFSHGDTFNARGASFTPRRVATQLMTRFRKYLGGGQ